MNGVAHSPPFQLFQRLTAVFDDLLGHAFHFPGWRQRGHQAGNAVDHHARLALAFVEVAIQPSIVERDRRLRGQQLQHRDPRHANTPGARLFSKYRTPISLAWFVSGTKVRTAHAAVRCTSPLRSDSR